MPYCYDSNRFRRMAVEKESPPTLLTVGRFEAHKNHQATIRAASRLGSGVQVRLIGRGPEAPTLARTASALRVSCRIETEADDDAVADAYHRSRVTVCPSRFEGFGLTPMEAIACGTPVVASDIPAHREFVRTAARLFPLDDDEALASAAARALGCNTPCSDLDDLTIPAAAARFRSGLRPML
jgi:glycosyltransferase involved in cell wall biosynthesis